MSVCFLEGAASFIALKDQSARPVAEPLFKTLWRGPWFPYLMGTAPVILHHFKPIWEQTDGGQAKPMGSWVAMPITAMGSY